MVLDGNGTRGIATAKALSMVASDIPRVDIDARVAMFNDWDAVPGDKPEEIAGDNKRWLRALGELQILGRLGNNPKDMRVEYESIVKMVGSHNSILVKVESLWASGEEVNPVAAMVKIKQVVKERASAWKERARVSKVNKKQLDSIMPKVGTTTVKPPSRTRLHGWIQLCPTSTGKARPTMPTSFARSR